MANRLWLATCLQAVTVQGIRFQQTMEPYVSCQPQLWPCVTYSMRLLLAYTGCGPPPRAPEPPRPRHCRTRRPDGRLRAAGSAPARSQRSTREPCRPKEWMHARSRQSARRDRTSSVMRFWACMQSVESERDHDLRMRTISAA